MNMATNLLTQFANGGNLVLQVSADDLREVMKSFYQEERERTEQAIKRHRENPTLDRKQTAKLLGVSLATLWKWAKDGYLVPAKIGTKVLYKPSDIDEILLKSKSDKKGGKL